MGDFSILNVFFLIILFEPKKYCHALIIIIIMNPIFIRAHPHKRRWPDFPQEQSL